MQLIVNTPQLVTKANELQRVINDLNQKRTALVQIQSSLDGKVRYSNNINQIINQINSKLIELENKLQRFPALLNQAAITYESADNTIQRNLSALMGVNSHVLGAENGLTSSNPSNENNSSQEVEEKTPWYKTLGKVVVGAGVIVGLGAIAAASSGVVATVAGAACLGAAIGSGLGAVSAIVSGESLDKIANEFMTGSITGAISGAVTGIFGEAGLFVQSIAGGASDFIVNGVDNIFDGMSVLDAFKEDGLSSFITGSLVSLGVGAMMKPDIIKKIPIVNKLEKPLTYVNAKLEDLSGELSSWLDYGNEKSMTNWILGSIKDSNIANSSFFKYDTSHIISDELIYQVGSGFIQDTVDTFAYGDYRESVFEWGIDKIAQGGSYFFATLDKK